MYLTPVMYIDPSVEFAMLNLEFYLDALFRLLEDIENFSLSNENETIVLQSNYFSYYKGSLVIKHSLPDTSCGIFGVILLNHNEYRINVVKHEWGHNQQEKQLVTIPYIFLIVIPSLNGYFNKVDDYYSQPWEYSADILGGVKRNYNYSITKKRGYGIY